MQKLFSGVKPSGNLHIGNYLGAVKQWVELQDDNEAIFAVMDLHAITVPQDPKELTRQTLDMIKVYLAAGVDPNKCLLFLQSHVAAHCELTWILNTITKNGDLTKMTQFKDKSGFNIDSVEKIAESFFEGENVQDVSSLIMDFVFKELGNPLRESGELNTSVENFKKIITKSLEIGLKMSAGNLKEAFIKDIKEPFNSVEVALFDYPVLMAADILLYDTAVVPVGDDQLQHIELARTLARRFNERFGETFIVPEGRIQKEGARIMGLDDPTKKMSKSAASEYNYISLTDDEETVLRKVKKAVTDSGTDTTYSDDRPGLKNLINIYSLFGDKTPDEIVTMYEGQGYGAFKTGLAGVISGFLTPFQERFAAISDDEVKTILEAGAVKAQAQAEAKMKQVRERVGLI